MFSSKTSSVVIVFLFYKMIQGEVYRWCDPYETFCLFSLGPDVTVSNFKEAQYLCTKIRNGSWPIEMENSRKENIVKQFIKNNLFPSSSSVVLNIELRNDGKLYWIEDSTKIIQIDLTINASICYKNDRFEVCSQGKTNFVICTIGCKASWTYYENQQVAGAYALPGITNLTDCKDLCETNKTANCTAVDFSPYLFISANCWIHSKPYSELNLQRESSLDTSNFVINRTMKSVDFCIGDISEVTNPTISTNHTASPATNLTLLVGAIVGGIIGGIVAISAIVAITIVIVKKKCNLNRKTETELEQNDAYEHMPESRETFLNPEHLYNPHGLGPA